MLHLSAARGAPAAAARTQQQQQRQAQQRRHLVGARRPASALAAAAARASTAAAVEATPTPTPTRVCVRPVGRRAYASASASASARPRALLPPCAAKPRDEAEIAKIKADAERDDPWSGDVAERLVKVFLVVAAGAVVATLLSLATPLINNTVGSFPSA